MKVTLLCTSDTVGGAAVVTFRLMNALRAEGIDARMLVARKTSDSPFVEEVPQKERKRAFLKERARIFAQNGFRRSTLFQIDTASDSVDISTHPLITEADIIALNWVNQGFLSFKELEKIMGLGKPMVWTMHDMWNMTGICHHAGYCREFEQGEGECRRCPLLATPLARKTLAHSVWKKKKELYSRSHVYGLCKYLCKHPCYSGQEHEEERCDKNGNWINHYTHTKLPPYTPFIHFVPVSHWLKERAEASSLMHGQPMTVIPNPFPQEALTPAAAPQSEAPHPQQCAEAESRWAGEAPLPQQCAEAESRWAGEALKGAAPLLPAKAPGKLRLLFGAARIDDPIKGHETLVETTRILARDYPEAAARLELITFGTMKNPEALSGVAIPHTHLGRVAPQDIRSIYENCDMVLSTSEWETLPGTLIEGQAWGCLPIALNHGGQPDIIEHQSTGFLAPFHSPLPQHSAEAESRWAGEAVKMNAAEMAAGILWGIKALSTKEKAAELRERMRSSVAEKFGEQKIALQYIALFEKLINERQAGQSPLRKRLRAAH